MKFIRLITITIFSLSILLKYSNSFSNPLNNEPQSDKSPTTVRAKVINVKRNSEIIELNDNAIIENEDTSILADKMLVYYSEDEKTEENKIKKIDAFDNVKVFNQEFIATGELGSYNPIKENFVITKNVVFNNGTSIAKGEKFIYDLKVRRGFLVGSKEDTNSLHSDRIMVIINEGNDE